MGGLARSEKKDTREEFGEQWNAYACQTPAFIPRIEIKIKDNT